MPQAVVPPSHSTAPDSPAPLRRRRQAVAPAPPAWRQRLLTYLLGFVTVILITDALVGDNGFLETLRARQQYAEISADLAAKRQENDRLRDEIRRLREDPATIEAIARDELGLMRSGEVLFIIHDKK